MNTQGGSHWKKEGERKSSQEPTHIILVEASSKIKLRKTLKQAIVNSFNVIEKSYINPEPPVTRTVRLNFIFSSCSSLFDIKNESAQSHRDVSCLLEPGGKQNFAPWNLFRHMWQCPIGPRKSVLIRMRNHVQKHANPEQDWPSVASAHARTWWRWPNASHWWYTAYIFRNKEKLFITMENMLLSFFFFALLTIEEASSAQEALSKSNMNGLKWLR